MISRFFPIEKREDSAHLQQYLIPKITPELKVSYIPYDYKENRLAVIIYERNEKPPISEDLLKLYYEAGETKKLLLLCNRLTDTYSPNYTLVEHRAATYMHLNDIPNAIKSCIDHEVTGLSHKCASSCLH